MGKRKNLRGSYTVEATFLMGILLALLTAVIYLGFYLHDRAFLQGAAHEAAVYACLHADDPEADAAAAAQTLVQNRTLGTRGVSAGLTADGKSAEAEYTGEFCTPGFGGEFFGSSSIPVRTEVSLTTRRPSRRIQMIRGIAKVINSVRRIRN